MKKILKITFSVIGIVLLCLLILAEIAKMVYRPEMETIHEKSKFARMIERIDRDCPIPVALGKGAVTSVKLENGYVTYYISYEKGFRNLLSCLDDESKAKEALLMCILCINGQGRNQGNLMLDTLAKFNYGLRVVITESANGPFECSATAEEIKSLRERYQLNPHEALYNLLSLSIQSEKASLPMEIDEGMLMTDYQLDSNNIIIVIMVDEDIYSVEEMHGDKEIIKASIIEEGLNDAESKALLDMCKVSHTGLVYRIKGNRSHKEFDVEISSEEIRRIVNTPEIVNIQ